MWRSKRLRYNFDISHPRQHIPCGIYHNLNIFTAMAKQTKGKRLNKKEIRNRLLVVFEQTGGETVNVKDIFRLVGATTHPAKMTVIDVLNELVFDDYLTTDQKGNYRHDMRDVQVIEGIFRRKKNGHNVFVPDDGGKDILVTERNSHHAMDGDHVRVTMLARRRSHTREAEVTEIIRRAKDTFVGKLQVERGYGFLLTERALATDIFIPKDQLKGGKTGDKVIVKITDWPEGSKSPIGKVIDVLGAQGDNDAEMHAILAEYGLPYQYPERVERAAEKLDPGITPEEIACREDFRDVPTFTIDPRDAKDFDDAISIESLGEGRWKVGVHIADVSHYVEEGGIIDREAFDRATSVYLVDRTIPMLPERLCNFICSLRQDEEKLAYSAIFEMDEKGEVLHFHAAKTVILSNRRFTYEEAQAIIERNGQASPDDLATPGDHPAVDGSFEHPKGEWAKEILMLDRLAKQLRAKRFKAGSIGFDRPEVRFEIDDKGKPLSTYIKIAKDANKLVEEFMLLANRSVAESVAIVPKGKQPKVMPYRIHDVPDPEKMEKLRGFVAKFGYKIRTEGTKTDVSKALNKLLDEVKGKKEEGVVELVALRAMMKARYSVHNIGHYGLMFRNYTHFTSPIRRYPDLMVHRLLAKYAEGGRSVSVNKYEGLCEHCSEREQIAATAERASIKYKQTEFMGERIGQEFDGVISGVTEFGIYVEDALTKCEGMVPLRDLSSDYYEFDEDNYRLVGRRTKRIYNLGDKVRFRVERANLERRQLDFSLIEDEGYIPPVPKKGERPKPKKQPALTSPAEYGRQNPSKNQSGKGKKAAKKSGKSANGKKEKKGKKK